MVLCSANPLLDGLPGEVCIAGSVLPGSAAFAAPILNLSKPGDVAPNWSSEPFDPDVSVGIDLNGGGRVSSCFCTGARCADGSKDFAS